MVDILCIMNILVMWVYDILPLGFFYDGKKAAYGKWSEWLYKTWFYYEPIFYHWLENWWFAVIFALNRDYLFSMVFANSQTINIIYIHALPSYETINVCGLNW